MMTKLADFYDAFGLMMYPVTHPEDSQNLPYRFLKRSNDRSTWPSRRSLPLWTWHVENFVSVWMVLYLLEQILSSFENYIKHVLDNYGRESDKYTLERSRGNRMWVYVRLTTSMLARDTVVYGRGCSVVRNGKATPKSHIKSLHNYIHLLHRWLNPFEMQMCTVTQLLVVRLAQV